MMMNKYAFSAHEKDAQQAVEAAEEHLKNIADTLVGRLRSVNRTKKWYTTDILRNLKRELKDFNAHTGEWK